MLPIRQHLLTLTCLKGNAKMVLIEVCELAENGKQGGCFVSNATLARDLGISLKTATRMVASLEAAGLLTASINKAQGNRRYLSPTPAVRACYVGGTSAQQLAAAAELTIVKSEPETDLTIVNSDPDYSQNGPLTIVKNDPDYSQNASRVYGDDHDDQVTTKDDHPLTPSERVGFQKKIADLEFENAQLKAKILEIGPPVAAPPHKPVAPPRLTTYRNYDGPWPEQFAPLFESLSFLNAWAQWGKYLAELGKPHRGHNHEQTDLAELGRMAAGSEPRAIEIITQSISAGWKRLIDHKPEANGSATKSRFGQTVPTPTRAGGSPSQAATYRPR
jgi:DNA-binding MarR family transcriptional regulator